MEQSPPWESYSLSCQEISCLLWNLSVQYHVHNSLQSVLVLSWMNIVHTPIHCFCKTHFNVSLLSMLMFSKWFPFRFSDWSFMCILHLPHLCSILHCLILDLTILMIFCEANKLWSYSLCSFLHSPLTSSTLGPHILLSSLLLNTLNLFSSRKVRD
jgi:hypothetical protein